MAASIFTSFDKQAQALWGRAPLRLDHNLHERDLFTDGGLAGIIDSLPDDLISIVTMGSIRPIRATGRIAGATASPAPR